MEKFAIILAGGEGRRAGGSLPKQFQDLNGLPVLWWSMKAFKQAYPEVRIVLVVHPGFMDDWDIIYNELPECLRIPYILSCGGRSRAESVKNGLLTISEQCGDEDAVVMIHDGARPLVTPDLIRRGLEEILPGKGYIPAVAPVSSLRQLKDASEPYLYGNSVSVARSDYMEVQTPQNFLLSTISSCYKQGDNLSQFTDDASVAEHYDVEIKLYEGDPANIKVTHPVDFVIAEALLNKRLSSK